ncbi:MAG: hypothetical protein ACRET8_07745 [Burkholderiales bacterium]
MIPAELPPLRERGDDIELLARLFLDRLNNEAATAKTLSGASLRFLRAHLWPGNVRELKNFVHRAYVFADDVLELERQLQ